MGSGEAADWIADAPGGSVIRVHVRPGARHAGIGDLHGEALSVRVGARPVDGAANDELLDLLAGALGCRAGALEIRSGHRGREKRVVVRGLSAEVVRTRLSVDKARWRA